MPAEQPTGPARGGHRSKRRRRGVLLLLVLLAAGLLRRRHRAEPAGGGDLEPELAPTRPVQEGRTSSVRPVLSARAAAPSGLPGRPRLAAVHGGTLPHAAVAAEPGELPLASGQLVVGRAPDADVRLDDPTVSPRHAVLSVAPDGSVQVRDLGTVNGVRVDGVPVVQAQLNDGNRLDLGEVQLVFRCDPAVDDGGRQGGELGEQPHQREQGTD